MKDEELFLKTTYSKFKSEIKDIRKWGFPLHIINKKRRTNSGSYKRRNYKKGDARIFK